jgi:NADH-quinone oxidoreductase subunit C
MSSDSEKPVEEKPVEEKPKPTPKPVAKPVAKPTPKPVAKKPEEKPVELPAFEKSISDKIVEKFGDKVEVAFVKEDRVRINVGRENVHDVAEFIRDGLNYDHVESVSGVDYPQDKEIEVVYHIGSYTDPSLAKQILVLATRAQREENPIPGNDATKLPTLRDIFYSVEFHEREIFEMLGVYFDGHPDNRRLLLPEDWADLPPLRKDFAIKGR